MIVVVTLKPSAAIYKFKLLLFQGRVRAHEALLNYCNDLNLLKRLERKLRS